jgi:flagellar protein FlaI
MFDLLKAALRQRPNEIIIGEIRGEEGAIAFQAMQTGHAAMATFHAATVEKLIQRLTGNPINVPKTYIDNLNLVLIQSAVRLPNGKSARRVLSLSEIIGYDTSSDAFSFIEMFRWNAENDTFEFTGKNNSFLLEQRIALKRGLPPAKRRMIYDEVDKRTRILQRLHKGKVTDFYELFTILAKANREGIFR